MPEEHYFAPSPYSFSNKFSDWNLEDTLEASSQCRQNSCKGLSKLKYWGEGSHSVIMPKISQSSQKVFADDLYFLGNYLNVKIKQLDTMSEDCCKKAHNLNGKSFSFLTNDLYTMQFHNIELVTFLRIYLDTCFLYFSTGQYDSIAKAETMFKKYNIQLTAHIESFLYIVQFGSNNLKHLARTQKFSHVPLESIMQPSIILELSTRSDPQNTNFVIQQMEELFKGANMLVYRLIVAAREYE